jgi:fibronectin type 3 domain-containing protein
MEVSGFSNGEYVSLVWVPNSEPDLAGYDIYRSADGKTYQRLTEQLEAASSFIDRKVEKGKLYYYRIRAVDTHKNQSEFSNDVSVRVE